jgi:hypothetical protein
MTRKPKHAISPQRQLEIGRLYELGKTLRGKALCLEYDICHQTLINFARAYRRANPRRTEAELRDLVRLILGGVVPGENH